MTGDNLPLVGTRGICHTYSPTRRAMTHVTRHGCATCHMDKLPMGNVPRGTYVTSVTHGMRDLQVTYDTLQDLENCAGK